MSLGIWQLLLILVIVLLLFGAGKLPRVMGDFAKGIKSFRSGLKEEETPTQPVAAPPVQPIAQPVNQTSATTGVPQPAEPQQTPPASRG